MLDLPMLTATLQRFLNTGAGPRKCDCIFVLAGKEERKKYGIDLWRRGYAPELILSVGRFEWRRFYSFGLPSDGGLKRLVDATPPQRRHFFVHLTQVNARAVLIDKRRLGTLTEARALAKHLRDSRIHSLMVVSSPIHMRRATLAFRHAFHASRIELNFVGLPPELSPADTPTQIWLELRKYLLYRLLL